VIQFVSDLLRHVGGLLKTVFESVNYIDVNKFTTFKNKSQGMYVLI